MLDTAYRLRRHAIETYFDRTAADAWAKLTSDAPVSGIRATVRRGRERMRALLLSWLPEDLTGLSLLDAGCGTGALAVEAARRGARVVAIDLSPKLVALAAERTPAEVAGRIAWRVGDFADPELGSFDAIVAMDSLIHYAPSDLLRLIEALGPRAGHAFLFTYAPRTPALALMHAAGKLFPRADRAPAIRPLPRRALRHGLSASAVRTGLMAGREGRVVSGFYTSSAQELVRP